MMGMGYSHQGQDKDIKGQIVSFAVDYSFRQVYAPETFLFSPHFYTEGWVLILLSAPWRYQAIFHIPVYNLQYASIICIWKMIFQWYTEDFGIP